MKFLITASAAMLALSVPAFAAGDAAKGEREFNKCKACHMIQAEDGTDIVKGGKTGPNLYGVIGRAAGAQEGFRYGESLAAAGEAGLVWDEENLASYVQDPKAFLVEYNDDPKARSSMSFKLAKGAEDVAAYLASVAPATN
ncbi:MAG: c-type cytochrome [Paracoccaceae bacterium]|jgi:cytochrome c|uniref:c-type cytochrome n=1 Tax=unclassified Seohaeicola TaxID=2641111 RepID=UPI00237A3149|nr:MULTISPECIES: c-type cytochrome [unclassified Seohaeicola]MDD9706949.1 c-type cytochrome [Seohaeicola sp. 4SK31]MDD9735185.1 c-type cytochrome [Seohaeicola sp. SP36]MDF1709704.1 c-type cytochrome [Paracoccaceae bacterium]MDM7968680.1 c-type cytochrome [Paracoccaceae bacterium]